MTKTKEEIVSKILSILETEEQDFVYDVFANALREPELATKVAEKVRQEHFDFKFKKLVDYRSGGKHGKAEFEVKVNLVVGVELESLSKDFLNKLLRTIVGE